MSYNGANAYLLVLLNHLKQVSPGTVLEDNPEVVPGLVPIEELENVPVFQIVENSHLVEHFLSAVLFDGLHCHVLDSFLFAALQTKHKTHDCLRMRLTLYTTEYLPLPTSS